MKNREQRPTIEEVREMDLVSYLSSLGYRPTKITGDDYWFLSPLREEKTASFKVNRKIGKWYDHGEGLGGDIITFAIAYHRCSIREFLDSFSGAFILQNRPVSNPQPIHPPRQEEHREIHLLRDRAIINSSLFEYLRQRRIPIHLADRYCRQVEYTVGERSYYGIGFPNDKKGYEIRNPYAKICIPPKSVSTINNGSNEVFVFEGFMDFLSFLFLSPEQAEFPRNYLVLNSLSMFEKARPFMESHLLVHLFLDHDEQGRKFTRYGLSLSEKYSDESGFYSRHKDLNDWVVDFGKSGPAFSD